MKIQLVTENVFLMKVVPFERIMVTERKNTLHVFIYAYAGYIGLVYIQSNSRRRRHPKTVEELPF